jgi:hypothetical protein
MAAIAERRTFDEFVLRMCPSARRRSSTVSPRASSGRSGRRAAWHAHRAGARVAHGRHRQRLRPATQPPIFGAPSGGLLHVDMAMNPAPHPDKPELTGVMLGGALRAGAHWRAGSARWSAWASSPASPTSPGTRPTSLRSSTRSACATAPTSWSTGSRSRRPSPSGRPSRSASTRPSCGSGSGAGSRPLRSPSPRRSSSRRASDRSSA